MKYQQVIENMVGRDGVEPPTPAFSAFLRCWPARYTANGVKHSEPPRGRWVAQQKAKTLTKLRARQSLRYFRASSHSGYIWIRKENVTDDAIEIVAGSDELAERAARGAE